MYKLNEDLLKRLKSPLGKLVKGNHSELDSYLKQKFSKSSNLVCVGDIISYHLIKLKINPKIIIIDYRTMRGEISSQIKSTLKQYNVREYKVQNPKSTLSEKAFNTIKKAFDSREKIKIIVDGEEDLLTLPAIIYAPLGAYVLYGQPDLGVVEVFIDTKKRQQIKNLLEEVKEWK